MDPFANISLSSVIVFLLEDFEFPVIFLHANLEQGLPEGVDPDQASINRQT